MEVHTVMIDSKSLIVQRVMNHVKNAHGVIGQRVSEFGRGLCLKVMAKDSLYYLKMLPLNNY